METNLHQVEAAQPQVRSVLRALALLRALGSNGRTLTALAAETDISLTTALRLLGTLRAAGFVTQDRDGLYGPGVELSALLYSTDQWVGIRPLAVHATAALRDRLDETVGFFVPAGADRLCIESAESMRLVRRVCPPGERGPIYLGAAGKAILANSGMSAAEALGLQRVTYRTATGEDQSVEELEAECARIRERGYAFSRQESTLESWAVAAPVRVNGRLVGSLAVIVPLTRSDESYIAAAAAEVVAATREINEEQN